MLTIVPAFYRDFYFKRGLKKHLMNMGSFRVKDSDSKWDDYLCNIRELYEVGETEIKVKYYLRDGEYKKQAMFKITQSSDKGTSVEDLKINK